MNTYVKFGALVVVVVGVLAWLALGGVSQNETYYKTITEVQKMGDQAHVKRLRVDGYVVPGSIVRTGTQVSFIIHQDPAKRAADTTRLKVVYNGTDPLPDTFKDDAQAMADGKLGADGVFQAQKIQAKCASKYEAKPQMKTDASRASL
jgi:cytochrome c-type biogenesis protein CcmE